MVATRSQVRKWGESFPMFRQLPPELRAMIWREAMPPHGIYPLYCDTYWTLPGYEFASLMVPVPYMRQIREESEHFVTKFCVAPPEDIERNSAIRKFFTVCYESYTLAKIYFPDVIPCCKGDIYFNGKEDLIFLVTREWESIVPSLGTIEFESNWYLRVRRLAIQDTKSCVPFGILHHTEQPILRYGETVNIFMDFLTRFQSLKQLVLVAPGKITVDRYDSLDAQSQAQFRHALENSYDSGITSELTRQLSVHDRSFTSLLAAEPWRMDWASGVKAVIHAGPEVKRKVGGQVKLGYEELRDVEVLGMVHMSPEMRAEGICREM